MTYLMIDVFASAHMDGQRRVSIEICADRAPTRGIALESEIIDCEPQLRRVIDNEPDVIGLWFTAEDLAIGIGDTGNLRLNKRRAIASDWMRNNSAEIQALLTAYLVNQIPSPERMIADATATAFNGDKQ